VAAEAVDLLWSRGVEVERVKWWQFESVVTGCMSVHWLTPYSIVAWWPMSQIQR